MIGSSIMRRINGEKFGRWSLRLDAAYCVMLGAAVALFSGRIAEGLALPAPLIAAVGVAVVVRAGGIVWMLARLPLRSALSVRPRPARVRSLPTSADNVVRR